MIISPIQPDCPEPSPVGLIQVPPLPVLPGISEETVLLSKMRYVNADEAALHTGVHASGLLIPYFDVFGSPIVEDDKQYCRLRLDEPIGDQKYHQRAGSKPHVYFPHHFRDLEAVEVCHIIEGEKKACALSDAGHLSIGMSGFYGYAQKTDQMDQPGRQLDPQLEAFRMNCSPEVMYFTGDKDTLFNCQFYDAAIKFSELFRVPHLYCCQVPQSAPDKGFDDCRAAMVAADFEKLYQESITNACGLQITRGVSVGALALKALRMQEQALVALTKNQESKEDLIRHFVKLAAGLKIFKCHYEQEIVVEMAVTLLGVSKSTFKALLKDRVQKDERDYKIQKSENEGTLSIEVGVQVGVWSAECARFLGEKLYWHGGQFVDVQAGEIKHYEDAVLASYVNRPGRVSFFEMANGGLSEIPVTEQMMKLVAGVPVHEPELVRPLKIVSNVPALVWANDEFRVFSGYDRESGIFAQGKMGSLPTPEDAVSTLLNLIRDFDFASPYDMARCLGFLLSPAIARSGYLRKERVPFFLVSKDHSGAGGSFLVRLVAAVYDMKPLSVVPDQKNPEKTYEGLSGNLAKGNALSYLDNVVGNSLSKMPFLESLITEPLFQARAPWLHATIDVSHEVFAATSNGAILSADMVKRTAQIKILKKPNDYEFMEWPEGGVVEHIEENRAQILAAIYALLTEYGIHEKEVKLKLSGMRFKRWEKCVGWIIQKYFPGLHAIYEPGYLTKKEAELSDPAFNMLVSIFRQMVSSQKTSELSASGLFEFAEEKSVPLDNVKEPTHLGKILANSFPHEGEHTFGGMFKVVRKDHVTTNSHGAMIKFYQVEAVNREVSVDQDEQACFEFMPTDYPESLTGPFNSARLEALQSWGIYDRPDFEETYQMTEEEVEQASEEYIRSLNPRLQQLGKAVPDPLEEAA